MKTLPDDEQITLEDNQLVAGLIKQNPDALDQLYHRYGPLLKSIIMQVLHDETDVDDVLQDVLMQVWQRPQNYSAEKGKLSSWLATLARRRAIDRVRQHSAYRRATDRYDLALNHVGKTVDEMHTVERDANRDDLKKLLDDHLNALPSGQKEAVRLAFLESKTQREISTLTGIPLGTIKTRIELGIKKLSSSLAGARAEIL
ncbi:MAG: sigma-70 family RNA polymerase sigma factor [Chthoniobacterales bacterium]